MNFVSTQMLMVVVVQLAKDFFAGADSAKQPRLSDNTAPLPLIISTWATGQFQMANAAAWNALMQTGTRLEAVVRGCTKCETLQCDHTVGLGGSPDDIGETTLDALLMDGPRQRMGAVGDLRRVKEASRVAWAVMNYTRHSFLVGESDQEPRTDQPRTELGVSDDISWATRDNHDTIGIIVIDPSGDISAGTTTNGANHKIHGMGDSPIPGAGAYVENKIGGAAATGDGDIMMRFLPCYQAVESMRLGLSPADAASVAIQRIKEYFPGFSGAVIAADKKGRHGAACNSMPWGFKYSVSSRLVDGVQVVPVNCSAHYVPSRSSRMFCDASFGQQLQAAAAFVSLVMLFGKL